MFLVIIVGLVGWVTVDQRRRSSELSAA